MRSHFGLGPATVQRSTAGHATAKRGRPCHSKAQHVAAQRSAAGSRRARCARRSARTAAPRPRVLHTRGGRWGEGSGHKRRSHPTWTGKNAAQPHQQARANPHKVHLPRWLPLVMKKQTMAILWDWSCRTIAEHAPRAQHIAAAITPLTQVAALDHGLHVRVAQLAAGANH